MYSVAINKQYIHVKFHPDRIKGWREILKKLFFGVRKKSLHVLIPIRVKVKISGFFRFFADFSKYLEQMSTTFI